jgi:hypothetical protein
MAAKRDDDLKDSFYLHIMRHSIGAGLKSQYGPGGHVPDRLNRLLKEIEADQQKRGADKQAGEDTAAGREHEPPARKHIRE